MSIGAILLIILVIFLLGGFGGPSIGAPWAYGYGAGNWGVGIPGIIIVILLILLVTGRL